MSKNKPSWRKYIFAAVILLVCVISGFIYMAAMWSPETSESQKASENKIRKAASRFAQKTPETLNDDDFAKITLLLIGQSSISSVPITVELTDIKLLKKFTNLQTLELGKIIYPKKDIPKWMILLAKLGIFDIDKRFALDLEPLKELHNLKRLTISQTAVKNIKPLSGLVNLQWLDLTRTTVYDLKPIKDLINLDYLNINNTQVTSLEPLKGFTRLQTLHISGCKNISDRQVEDLHKALPNLKIKQ